MEGCLLQYFLPVFSADWAGFWHHFSTAILQAAGSNFSRGVVDCRRQFIAMEL
jgi:hypothetical protein